MSTVILPYIGVPTSHRSLALLENHPEKIVGSFWIMCGYGFEDDEVPQQEIPGGWIDLVLEQNQAQAILDYVESNEIHSHDDLLYHGYCMLIVAGTDNPANIAFVIEHIRISREGHLLLTALAKHNIPAITEVMYPEDFGQERPEIPKNMGKWTIEIWDNFCNLQLARHGERMLQKFWSK